MDRVEGKERRDEFERRKREDRINWMLWVRERKIIIDNFGVFV